MSETWVSTLVLTTNSIPLPQYKRLVRCSLNQRNATKSRNSQRRGHSSRNTEHASSLTIIDVAPCKPGLPNQAAAPAVEPSGSSQNGAICPHRPSPGLGGSLPGARPCSGPSQPSPRPHNLNSSCQATPTVSAHHGPLSSEATLRDCDLMHMLSRCIVYQHIQLD